MEDNHLEKKEEEKHLVLTNPKMFESQSDMINEMLRDRTTSTIAYGAREDLFGILHSIQALHSRKKFLLTEVQRTNAGKWTGLVFAPFLLTSHCWNVCES